MGLVSGYFLLHMTLGALKINITCANSVQEIANSSLPIYSLTKVQMAISIYILTKNIIFILDI